MVRLVDGMEALGLCGGGVRFDLFPLLDRGIILAVKSDNAGNLSTEWLLEDAVDALLMTGMECCFRPASFAVLRHAARAFNEAPEHAAA